MEVVYVLVETNIALVEAVPPLVEAWWAAYVLFEASSG